jgi:drug/metabolite transporter (DMT)-like permease
MLVGERPSSLIYVALPATLAGTLAMSGFGMTALAWGDGMCLAAACAYALWLPLVGKFVTAFGRPIFLTAGANLVCGGVCVTIGLIEEPQSAAAYLKCLPDLLLLGIVSKAIAFVLMAAAQRHVSSAVAAIIGSSESVFGTLFAYLWLSESLGTTAIVGAGLILCGSVLVNCARESENVFRCLSTLRLCWFRADWKWVHNSGSVNL